MESVLGTGAFGKVVKVRCRWLAAAELRLTLAPACAEIGDSRRGSYLFQWWHTTNGVLWMWRLFKDLSEAVSSTPNPTATGKYSLTAFFCSLFLFVDKTWQEVTNVHDRLPYAVKQIRIPTSDQALRVQKEVPSQTQPIGIGAGAGS